MHTRQRLWRAAAGVAALVAMLAGSQVSAQEPIKIGFAMSQTGGLAPNGKSSLLGMKIWEEDINAKGGLLGRKVKLVLRRPEHGLHGPGPLRQAARRG